jgi:lipoyl-dependent peroxiredoxin
MSALGWIAKQRQVAMDAARVACRVDVLKGRDGFTLAVELAASLPSVSSDEAKALLDLAHQRCPFSKATLGNIDVTLTVV